MSTASHAQPTGIPAKPSPLTTQVWATVRLATIFAGVYLAQGALLRLILWGFFGQEAGLHFSALPSVLGLGSIRDLDAALYLFLPLLVLSLLAPRRLLASRFGRVAFACGSFAFLFALEAESPRDTLRRLATQRVAGDSDAAWLTAAALHFIQDHSVDELNPLIRRAAERDRDALVQETAGVLLRQAA